MKELFDFSKALKLVRQGKRIARNGWNGKGMFVVYQRGYPNGIPSNRQTAEAWGLNEGDLFKVEPYLQIKMANGSHAMWVASINDLLAEDWHVVEFETKSKNKEVSDVYDWVIRLKQETEELIKKINKLHDYMKTTDFYNLSREEKDLLYEQEEHMMKYLRVLGVRCENYGILLNEV